MGCLFGKLSGGFGPFPLAAPRIAAPAHRPPLRTAPPPAEPPRRRIFIPYSPGDAPTWPAWLLDAAGDALDGWPPRRADSFEKLEKIGSGTYSNVYKARDMETGRVVALKKVRVESVESAESVRFMVREIALLRRLDHPNVVRLEGLAVSRVPTSPSLYLVFEYMEHDLAGLASRPGLSFTEPQVKCYMKQLLSGLEHCHSRGILHRDIKCSNLLLNRDGILKIADFGLANYFNPDNVKPMTNQVVTLWYRPPELLLGATHYDVGVDLWSAGCILAELFTRKPILPGRTEVEQLHRILKLCGSPSEDYFEKQRLQHMTSFKPYKRRVSETFSDLSPSSVALIDRLLSLDPLDRGSATSALNSDFFNTEPFACDPSGLPQCPPSKEMDRKLRERKERRKQRLNANGNGEPNSRIRLRNTSCRGPGAPKARAKRLRLLASASVARTEKFPPPHLDAAIGFSLDNTSYDESCATLDEILMSSRKPVGVTASSVDNRSSHSKRMNEGGRRSTPRLLLGAITPYLLANFSELRR